MEDTSDFSQERLIEEHDALKAKIDRLRGFVYKYNNGLFEEGFELACPIRLLTEQLRSMETYAAILRERIAVAKMNK